MKNEIKSNQNLNAQAATPPGVLLEQHICGGIFIVTYAMNMLLQVLMYLQVIPYGLSGMAAVMGLCSIVGYVLLYRLAANEAGEVFAISLICVEAYFSFVLPYFLMKRLELDHDFFAPVIGLCAIFCVLAVYFWSVLFCNNSISRSDMRWVGLVPISYLINFCNYWSYLSPDIILTNQFEGWNTTNLLMTPLWCIMSVFMAIGFWRLSHSAAFTGVRNDKQYSNYSPINRYTFGFGLSVVLAMLLF